MRGGEELATTQRRADLGLGWYLALQDLDLVRDLSSVGGGGGDREWGLSEEARKWAGKDPSQGTCSPRSCVCSGRPGSSPVCPPEKTQHPLPQLGVSLDLHFFSPGPK